MYSIANGVNVEKSLSNGNWIGGDVNSQTKCIDNIAFVRCSVCMLVYCMNTVWRSNPDVCTFARNNSSSNSNSETKNKRREFHQTNNLFGYLFVSVWLSACPDIVYYYFICWQNALHFASCFCFWFLIWGGAHGFSLLASTAYLFWLAKLQFVAHMQRHTSIYRFFTDTTKERV